MSAKKVDDNRSGFWIHPSSRTPGAWVADAVGTYGWFVDGFASRRAALNWTMGYLTTVNENNTRISLEEAAAKRDEELHRQAVMAAVLETTVKKGQEN